MNHVHFLREIVEQWHARLSGEPQFDTRRLETRTDPQVLQNLSACFPQPTRSSLAASLKMLIFILEDQRLRISQKIQPKWTVSDSTRKRLREAVEQLDRSCQMKSSSEK